MPSKTARGSRVWVEQMRDRFDRGRFREAAQIFDTVGDIREPTGALMRARIYLKDSSADAIGFIQRIAVSKPDHRAERDMLLGVASARLRDFATADHYLDLAEAGSRADALLDELRYHRVRRILIENRLPDARAELALLRNTGREPIRVLHLESFILSQEGRYAEQACVLVELLGQIEPTDTGATEINAWATHTLAALCRDTYAPSALPIAERHLNESSWPEDFTINRFQSLKSVGWARALQGDYFNAFRYLKQASDIAPSTPWKVIALADRAYLARCLGESRWSRQELAEAELAADQVEWHATRGEERVGLLLLAELLAPIDPARASFFLAQHGELPTPVTSLAHYAFDDRPAALSDYTAGIVHASLGHKRIALTFLRRSLTVFDRDGYDWRAGRASLAIYSLTRERELLDLASERLRHYDSSWLGDELQQLRAAARSPILPPMQGRILEAICDGLTPQEIADDFGLAYYTVKNHLKLIFKAFNVNSRPALLVEAARLGHMDAGTSSNRKETKS